MQAQNQGLGQLMQQRQQPGQQGPQGQPGPSPMKASPMAGMGSVEDRVAAYRGNPAPLQQRYAMSQDMLDLLALQKIKSEKESAARDMQLKMAQQQAAQGEPPTVAQQREQEVRDLTKREMAQQVGATGNQQLQAQQSAMQKLAQGIARAPGANMVAQPQRMATGGIVAFAGGGDTTMNALREYLKSIGMSNSEFANASGPERARIMRAFEATQPKAAAPTPKPAAPEAPKPSTAYRAGESAGRGARGLKNVLAEGLPRWASKGLGIAGLALEPRDIANEDEALAAMRGEISDPKKAESILKRFGMDYATPESEAGPEADMQLQPEPALAKPEPSAAEQAAPTVTTTATPTAAPTPAAPRPAMEEVPQVGLDGGLADLQKQQQLTNMQLMQTGMTPQMQDAQRAEEYRVEGLMGLRPEERAVYDKNIAERQAIYDQTYNPEAMRKRGLKDFLIGAGGRRYNVLGGAAKVANAADDARHVQRLKELRDIQADRLKPIAIRRNATKEGIASGLESLKQASQNVRQGLASATTATEGELGRQATAAEAVQKRNFDRGENALDREVDRLKIAAQQETNRINREGMNLQRAQATYGAVMNRAQELERKMDDDFAAQYGMLLMNAQTGKLDPAQQQQLDAAQIKLKIAKAKIRQDLEPVLAPLRRSLGMGSAPTPEDQDLVNKYLGK